MNWDALPRDAGIAGTPGFRFPRRLKPVVPSKEGLMDQRTTTRARLNWLLPSLYAAAIVLTASFGNGRATSIVATVGGVLLGLYYGFGSRLGRRG